MKIDKLQALVRGTKLIWERTGGEYEFIGPYTEELGAGAYATRVYAKGPDGRECLLPAGELQNPEDPDLTPAQVGFLLHTYRNGGTVYSAKGTQPRTAARLIKLGLATPGRGLDEWRREYLSPWGGELTELGKRVAARLAEEER